jgi:flagellin
MTLRINQNIAAMSAHRWLQTNDTSMAKSIERLSSGFRINSAADDAAGLVISETLRTKISGLTVAYKNTQDGINMIKTGEKALDEIETQLRSIRDLTLHAANANGNKTLISADQAQVDQALDSVDRIANQTEFGGVKLLADDTGTDSIEGKTFQIGGDAGQRATFNAVGVTFGVDSTGAALSLKTDMHAASLGFTASAGSYAETTSGSAYVALGAAGTEDFDITWEKADGTVQHITLTVTSVAGAESDAEYADLINAQLAGSATVNGTAAQDVSNLLEATVVGGKISIGVVDRMENQAELNSSSTVRVRSEASIAAKGALYDTLNGAVDSGSTATSGITLDGADFDTLLGTIDDALKLVEGLRVNMGAFQKNNLESNLASVSVAKENLAASESAIRDTDMAGEMMSFTRAQILMQASQSMMAQANSAPQSILQMLR